MSDVQLFDVLPPAIEDALRESIRRFGVLVPIVEDQDGNILDGHHRQRIAHEEGRWCSRVMVKCASDEERVEVARTLNMDRRHLTEEQRREVVQHLASLTDEHGVGRHSPNAIAEAVGSSLSTVQNDMQVTDDGNLPDRRYGLDGKIYPASRIRPGDTVEDDSGDARTVTDIEDAGDELVLHDGQGDALIVGRDRDISIRKPDLDGTGVSHPARYTDTILPVFADILTRHQAHTVLDPFAGTGRIHELRPEFETVGVEIEPEWANLHEHTICGNALNLEAAGLTPSQFDAVCTSPTYGNRLADSHHAADPERRRSYTHDLGRPLHADNSGDMQWGDTYRAFHRQAWTEIIRFLRPGGVLILNIKDHIRDGRPQGVDLWHTATLAELGLTYLPDTHAVAVPGLRTGTNSELRVGHEWVLQFVKAEESV